jgi:hypothetical protein
MNMPRRDLDDPEYAAFAWGRFKRILRWMALAALATAGLAELALWSMADGWRCSRAIPWSK